MKVGFEFSEDYLPAREALEQSAEGGWLTLALDAGSEVLQVIAR
jgi:hypothetical protein